ncbi:hypothetical protein QQS21_005387 [Conoideocrella luteorostrata]|uniref:Uncharacterized protein n=1 Tax=Conoideocrella luteorostrata TaxID=1105319 RepID=A0AAJ0CS93_9HYPO|nr:hypothetical protein QQS21_005387 [Conoideocrella luteorostrata]
MLAEDPEVRSSADYCHDEALKLITDTQYHEAVDDDYNLTTPKHVMPNAESAMKSHDEDSEAATLRPVILSTALDTPETPVRKTVEGTYVDKSHFADCNSAVNEWERSEASDLDTQPGQAKATFFALRPESMVSEPLWNHESSHVVSRVSKHEDEAIKIRAGETWTETPLQQRDISFPGRHYSGRKSRPSSLLCIIAPRLHAPDERKSYYMQLIYT